MIFKNKINLLFLCFLLFSCQANNQALEETDNSELKREIEQGLILFNSTLEQSNAQGKILWRLKTEKATYSPDKQTAKLENLTANLFNNDILILQISADKGELRKDGQEIYIQDNIIAVDPRNKAEFRGEEMVWLPEENIMTITGKSGFKANHAKLTVRSVKAKYNTENQILELDKDIIATTNNPSLQLKTQHLYWQIEKEKVIGNEKLDLIRYEDKIVTDRLKTDKIEVDLNTKIALINGNIEYQSFQPLLQAATNKVIWYYAKREMESPQAITLVQSQEGTTITANRGKFNLTANQVDLQGGIYGKTEKNQAQIYADKLNLDLDTQNINAYGNVNYQQLEPDLNVTGKTARGNLKNKNIIVEGNTNNQVETVIYSTE